ncbi:MAG: hypothetical protein U9P50_02025 [Patescibacteria group bacterium]|nr:hypothetical protein [Patescibacteria group bacterium]
MGKQKEVNLEDGGYLMELESIMGRERPIRYFADDDYSDWIEFRKKQRQDLSRLLYNVPEDHPVRGHVLKAAKEVL